MKPKLYTVYAQKVSEPLTCLYQPGFFPNQVAEDEYLEEVAGALVASYDVDRKAILAKFDPKTRVLDVEQRHPEDPDGVAWRVSVPPSHYMVIEAYGILKTYTMVNFHRKFFVPVQGVRP